MASVSFTMPDGSVRDVPVPAGMDPNKLEPQHIQSLFQQVAGGSGGAGAAGGNAIAGPTGANQHQIQESTPPTPLSPRQSGSSPVGMQLPQDPQDPLGFLIPPSNPVSVRTDPPANAEDSGPLLDAIADRTTRPMQTIVDPNATFMARLGAAGTLIATATQPGIALGGVAVQTAGQMAGAGRDSANLISQAVELGAGLLRIPFASAKATQAGKAAINEGERTMAAVQTSGFLPRENVAMDIQAGVRKTLGQRNRTIGNAFDALEKNIIEAKPAIPPNSPGYADVGAVVQKAIDGGPIIPSGKSGEMLARINTAVKNGQPIATQDLVDLRTALRKQASFTGNPDADLAARFAAELHGDATRALATSLPADLSQRMSELGAAYKTQWVDPALAVRGLTSRQTTAVQAFDRVFNLQDPSAFRNVMNLVGGNPGLKTKLRAGFIDSLRDISGNFGDAATVSKSLNQAKGSLVGLGLFTTEETQSMKLIFDKKAYGTVVNNLTQNFGYVKFGGALAATRYFTHDPTALFSVAAAAGGLPLIRKMMLLPPGHPAAVKAATMIASKIANAGAAMQQVGNSDPPEASVTHGFSLFHR